MIMTSRTLACHLWLYRGNERKCITRHNNNTKGRADLLLQTVYVKSILPCLRLKDGTNWITPYRPKPLPLYNYGTKRIVSSEQFTKHWSMGVKKEMGLRLLPTVHCYRSGYHVNCNIPTLYINKYKKYAMP